MNYKVSRAINKNRKSFLICAILWLILVIVFVVPCSYTNFQAKTGDEAYLTVFLEQFPVNISHPFKALGAIFSEGATDDFISSLLIFSVIYLVLFFIGLSKSMPKSEYQDIEHGSSDWCQHGEQYKILSRNSGIILAEDNYLPVDKRGNVNVLVVGRIWFW